MVAKSKLDIAKPAIVNASDVAIRYLDIKLVCKMLTMSEGAVRNLVYRREIPHYKLGQRLRFREDEIRTFMESKRVEADPRIAEAMTLTKNPKVA